MFGKKRRSASKTTLVGALLVAPIAIGGYLFLSSGPTSSDNTTIPLATNTENRQALDVDMASIKEAAPASEEAIAAPEVVAVNGDVMQLDPMMSPVQEFVAQPQLPVEQWQSTKVKSGDSLARIFSRMGFSARSLHDIMALGESTSVLKKVRPGETVEFVAFEDGSFKKLRYQLSYFEDLVVEKVAESYVAGVESKPVEVKRQFVTADIKSSFWNAAKGTGMPDGLIMELAAIFGWDIDFALEIREGDSFRVLYEQEYVDGKPVGYGNILSTKFVNQNEEYAAVRYEDSKGKVAYFTPDGKAMRKAFLRAPLNFNYVSSNFNPKRFHPVLKRVKPHRGVDYGAPVGAPVRAAGDGRVVQASYNKYNGNYVFIQHGNNIVTKYLHFSKKAVKKGQRVKQGQTIGYVGATGMVSGPHLHYEFVVNGVHRNPRTVKFPHAAPVPKDEMPRFVAHTADLVADLELEEELILAKLETLKKK